MASPAAGTQPAAPGPVRSTKYYFAYGSNLHLKQMKRRCPNSKYVGLARLVNYRWQINERGYANVIDAEGHWVDGLVYEINEPDEAKLDVNEGVSKNAYTKRHMKVDLHRAPSTLYRRPVSWIVDNGGPTKILRQAKQEGRKQAATAQQWSPKVLVYISLNYIVDSEPKDEYVNRINLGLVDAQALGFEEDYISNCIRPFIPARNGNTGEASAGVAKPKPAAPRGQKRNASPRSGEPSPARKGPTPNQPNKQTPRRNPVNRNRNQNRARNARVPAQDPTPPPLPPRPGRRY